jgi:two-component system response regulator HydG
MADAQSPGYELILADLAIARAAGRTLLDAGADSPTPELRVFCEGAALEDAVAAMRCGASDFLKLPLASRELAERVAEALRRVGSAAGALTSTAAPGRPGRAPLVAESEAMRETVALARRVAPLHSTVLLTGETGTGKELVAALIHDCSPRAHGPFVKVNCAALPETLLESELFGHERGAFTGAERRRVGRFEQASAGTLFLDEIGETSTSTQVKLLRVLQEGEYHRLGGVATLRTEARIVAATNRDLGDALREGRFREDLFFRLNVVGIHLTPLRERPEDTRALAEHFLADLCNEFARSRRSFSPEAMRRLCEHRWSGNVRELRNVIERAVLMSDRPRIEGAEIVLDRSAAFLDAIEQVVLAPEIGRASCRERVFTRV